MKFWKSPTVDSFHYRAIPLCPASQSPRAVTLQRGLPHLQKLRFVAARSLTSAVPAPRPRLSADGIEKYLSSGMIRGVLVRSMPKGWPGLRKGVRHYRSNTRSTVRSWWHRTGRAASILAAWAEGFAGNHGVPTQPPGQHGAGGTDSRPSSTALFRSGARSAVT